MTEQTTTKPKSLPLTLSESRGLLSGELRELWRKMKFKDNQDESEHHNVWWCVDHWQDGDLWLRCPYRVGDVLAGKEETYLSECGQFLCLYLGPIANYEAWSIDGAVHYRCDKREGARRPLRYCVGGYCCRMTDQRKGTFNLGLCECNPRKVIKPFTGNTIIKEARVAFRRKRPARSMPLWACRHWLKVTAVRAQERDGVWGWVVEVTKEARP